DFALHGGGLAVRPRLTRIVGSGFQPQASARDHLAFVLTQDTPASRRFHQLFWGDRDKGGELGPVGRVARVGMRRATATARSVDRWRKSVTDQDGKVRVFNEVLVKLPVIKGTVVFESHLGKQYSDSPRAIYEELRRRGVPLKAVWAYEKSPEGFPDGVELVERWSWRYLKALAQAEYW